METYTTDVITDYDKIGACEEVAIFKPNYLTPETPALFALHGMWATYRRNERYGSFFANRGYLVIAPTYRHHYVGNCNNEKLGKVSVLNNVADVERLIEQLAAGNLISGHLPCTRPILLGHSMGGLVTQVIAERRHLAAAVLLNSAPPAGVSLHANEDYQKRIKKIAAKILSGKPYLPDFETMCRYVYNNMPEVLHKQLYAKAVCESGMAAREIIAGSGDGFPKLVARLLSEVIAVNASTISCPMLVIGCEKDKIIPPAIAKDLYAKYVSRDKHIDSDTVTTLHIFTQFAHWAQYEPGWEASAEFIYAWLKQYAH